MDLVKAKGDADWTWVYFWANISLNFAYDPKAKQWWGLYDAQTPQERWLRCDSRDVPEELVKNQKVIFG